MTHAATTDSYRDKGGGGDDAVIYFNFPTTTLNLIMLCYKETLLYDERINRFYFPVLAAESNSLTKGPQRSSDDYCCNQANAGSPLLLPTQTQRRTHPQLDSLARLLQTVIRFTW